MNGRALTETVMTLQPWTRKDFEAAVDRMIAARNIRNWKPRRSSSWRSALA